MNKEKAQEIKDHLKKFFTISNAAFDFQATIVQTFGKVYSMNKMHQLHRMAKFELEKENPDFEFICNLLKEMEDSAKN